MSPHQKMTGILGLGFSFGSALILMLVYLLLPILDMFTGLLIAGGLLREAGLGSPSQIGRFIVTLILIVALTFRRLSLGWLYFLLIGCFFESINGIIHQHAFGLLYGYATLFRISFYFILVAYLASALVRKKSAFVFCLRFNIFIIGSSIVLSFLLGFGSSTYGWGFGTKGFFASGNGLGLYVGAMTIYLIGLKNYVDGCRIGYLELLLSVLACVLIGSKTAIVLGFLALALLVLESRYRWVLLLLSVVALIGKGVDLIATLETTFDVLASRFHGSESLGQFLFSGRISYVESAFVEFSVQQVGIFRYLFGGGVWLSFQDPSIMNLGFDTLETDFFDVFFMYGMVGLLGYLLMFFFGYCTLRKYPYFLLVWSLLFLHSLFAGHVIFNAMSLTAMATVLSTGIYLNHLRSGALSRVHGQLRRIFC